MNKLTVRAEKEGDFDEIYHLVKEAFRTAKVSDGDEQDYVIKLRVSENYLPELAMILTNEIKIIGHIMLTKMLVTKAQGTFEALLLSPVCICEEYRNRGVGSDFIRYALTKAREKGYEAVFLVGDPGYYQRFGFKPTIDYGIRHTGDIPEQYVLGLEMEKGVLEANAGTISVC